MYPLTHVVCASMVNSSLKPMIFTSIFAVSLGAHPKEYLYPVAASYDTSGQRILYLIYQKSCHHLELFAWNPVTKKAVPVLGSHYKPAGLRMLAHDSGFSFIDNGRIRIKKRGVEEPSALALDAPLYDFSPVVWFDDENGYCTAKKRDRCGIFQLNMQGHSVPVAYSIAYDCLYPNKVGNELFYIERSVMPDSCQYEIVRIKYPSLEYDQRSLSTVLRSSHQCNNDGAQTVADFGDRPLIFLTMISAAEGFVIEYPSAARSNDATIEFTYHHIWKDAESHWHTAQLFTFSIPTCLVTAQSSERLYESLLPLLPRHNEGIIYFVGARDGDGVSLHSYCLADGITSRLAQAQPGYVFCVPFVVDGVAWCGGTVGSLGVRMGDGLIELVTL